MSQKKTEYLNLCSSEDECWKSSPISQAKTTVTLKPVVVKQDPDAREEHLLTSAEPSPAASSSINTGVQQKEKQVLVPSSSSDIEDYEPGENFMLADPSIPVPAIVVGEVKQKKERAPLESHSTEEWLREIFFHPVLLLWKQVRGENVGRVYPEEEDNYESVLQNTLNKKKEKSYKIKPSLSKKAEDQEQAEHGDDQNQAQDDDDQNQAQDEDDQNQSQDEGDEPEDKHEKVLNIHRSPEYTIIHRVYHAITELMVKAHKFKTYQQPCTIKSIKNDTTKLMMMNKVKANPQMKELVNDVYKCHKLGMSPEQFTNKWCDILKLPRAFPNVPDMQKKRKRSEDAPGEKRQKKEELKLTKKTWLEAFTGKIQEDIMLSLNGCALPKAGRFTIRTINPEMNKRALDKEKLQAFKKAAEDIRKERHLWEAKDSANAPADYAADDTEDEE